MGHMTYYVIGSIFFRSNLTFLEGFGSDHAPKKHPAWDTS